SIDEFLKKAIRENLSTAVKEDVKILESNPVQLSNGLFNNSYNHLTLENCSFSFVIKKSEVI
ncbi:hypothetical protein ACM6ZS_005182, partial [Escherichia coli]